MKKINGPVKTYLKKPIPVKAYQWFGISDYCDGADDSVKPYTQEGHAGSLRRCEKCNDFMYNHGFIMTLEGGHIVCGGDYILTGIENEKWAVKERIFKATYEELK